MAERQTGKYLEDIRSDHVERYVHAAKKVTGNVLDAGCGCGYGSYLLCLKNAHVNVTGVDNSKEAIEYAKKHWQHHRNNFFLAVMDCMSWAASFMRLGYSVIVKFRLWFWLAMFG